MAEKPDPQEHQGGDAESESNMSDRWSRDHAAGVPRTSSGGLPLGVVIASVVVFALGFYLFRRWRSQYVTYGSTDSAEQLPSLLSALGLG